MKTLFLCATLVLALVPTAISANCAPDILDECNEMTKDDCGDDYYTSELCPVLCNGCTTVETNYCTTVDGECTSVNTSDSRCTCQSSSHTRQVYKNGDDAACYSCGTGDGGACSLSDTCNSKVCKGNNCCNDNGRSTGCTDCNSNGDCSTCSSNSNYHLSGKKCVKKSVLYVFVENIFDLSGPTCFGGNTTYKGQRYMQSGDEEFGEGNTTCFTRKYTVAPTSPGSSKMTPFIPIPEAEVDRICVTREHVACVVSKQGEHVSLPVAYLKEGLVLCDQSVVSELAEEQHSSLLFIAKKPNHPINNILSQFGASVDSIEISEEQLADFFERVEPGMKDSVPDLLARHNHQALSDFLFNGKDGVDVGGNETVNFTGYRQRPESTSTLVASSLVAPGKPYADIMLMERIPQYYMSMNISAYECLKAVLDVADAARACQTFSCGIEILESERHSPAKLDPELKSWLMNYISKTYIPKLASTCFPTSLNDLYNTLTDPEGTCIKKLRFDGGAPVAVLKSLQVLSPSFVCQNTLDSKECRESMRGCCRAVDGKKRYNPAVADTQTFLDSTSIAEAATTCSATCATDVACTAVEVSKRGKKHPARCEFFTNTQISSSNRASKSCKKAECIVKKDYAAPVAEPTPSGQPVPLLPETSAPTATPTTLPVWNELRGCCREITGKKKFSHHNTATIVKLAESSATAAAAACKQQCSDDSTCSAAEFSTKNKPKKNKKNKKNKNKKNNAAVYMCERHTATGINSATRATRSCKKATCSIKT